MLRGNNNQGLGSIDNAAVSFGLADLVGWAECGGPEVWKRLIQYLTEAVREINKSLERTDFSVGTAALGSLGIGGGLHSY